MVVSKTIAVLRRMTSSQGRCGSAGGCWNIWIKGELHRTTLEPASILLFICNSIEPIWIDDDIGVSICEANINDIRPRMASTPTVAHRLKREQEVNGVGGSNSS